LCPSYAPNTTFSCTVNFPAGASAGTQFELDLYDTKPSGSSAGGVGGVIPQGTTAGNPHSITLPALASSRKTMSFTGGTTGGTVGQCHLSGGSGACILGAALSNPELAIPLPVNQQSVQLHQIEGFVAQVGNPAVGIFNASEPGPGPGSPISGPAVSLGFDAAVNDITSSGSCVQDNGNEYANALTPSADEAPSPSPGYDQVTGNVGGGGLYHEDNGAVISSTTGSAGFLNSGNAPTDAAEVAAGEFRDSLTAGTIGLTTFLYTPCLLGYTGGTSPFIGSNFGIAPVNFPGDTLFFQYEKPGTVPQPSVWNGTSGDTGNGDPAQGIVTSPYRADIFGFTRDYIGYDFLGGTNCVAGAVAPCGSGAYGTSNGHYLPDAQATLRFVPLWGQVGGFVPGPGCTPVPCTTPFAEGGLNFTQAAGGGSRIPIVDMQGTGSNATVYALQAFVPTSGAYSNNFGSVNCAGVVSQLSGPTGPLFGVGTGGASWVFVGQASQTPGLTCTVTFTDGFNPFQVTFTNTGVINPGATPSPSPSPSPSPFGGATAPASPTV